MFLPVVRWPTQHNALLCTYAISGARAHNIHIAIYSTHARESALWSDQDDVNQNWRLKKIMKLEMNVRVYTKSDIFCGNYVVNGKIRHFGICISFLWSFFFFLVNKSRTQLWSWIIYSCEKRIFQIHRICLIYMSHTYDGVLFNFDNTKFNANQLESQEGGSWPSHWWLPTNNRFIEIFAPEKVAVYSIVHVNSK